MQKRPLKVRRKAGRPRLSARAERRGAGQTCLKEVVKQYILLDVGGTEIKGGISDENGNLKGQIRSFHACADQDMQTIFVNFALILRELMDQNPGAETAGVGFAFPGPFDYGAGLSLMQGLSKYDSIFGVPIEPEIKNILPALADVPFTFLHDVEAFALGESFYGPARGWGRVLCVCIGTSAGSAFIENGRTVKEQRSGDVGPGHAGTAGSDDRKMI